MQIGNKKIAVGHKYCGMWINIVYFTTAQILTEHSLHDFCRRMVSDEAVQSFAKFIITVFVAPCGSRLSW